MLLSYSLHKIDSPDISGFEPEAYSQFKFGNDAVAKAFGQSLADGFIREHLAADNSQKQFVVISSPYSFIPTATFAMKNHFAFRLNRWLAENGMPVLQETKVHRTVTYKEDYGELNAEERLNLISNDSFHIDKDFLAGKTLLFLDDIKITGSHEKMILRMVETYGLKNDIYMLYFGELVNKNIHPNIENYLNYRYVRSIFDLENIIRTGDFVINTRVVKYLLNYDKAAFGIFLQNQTEDFISNLYDMALGNGYHTIDAYRRNLELLKNNLVTQNNKLYQYGN